MSRAYAVVAAAAGAGLVLFAASRPWAGVAPAERTGADLYPWLSAAALLALAGAGALLAVRGSGRILVGVLLAAAAVAIAGGAVHALATDVRTGWLLLVAVGGVGPFYGGVMAIRGRDWTTTGDRYERPGATTGPAAMWDALDRGEDPTDR
ncbi:hypothetical protein Val02_89130 [Virgisporangium aliadipatigenens]|uniref:Tryptophan-associated transmembrane protein n=1 Tax=Virgisporangium aliadipatigenens TaxID=741659 RepID=A0A8J3YWX2_9ACTN|nr:Trp biosynthesis-associated membrane protein [Virgisporangium aliadipatigenens]GIJ52027.1 hypothetical protein Val02_89130 [Virgisporangium aliadipatigenens]